MIVIVDGKIHGEFIDATQVVIDGSYYPYKISGTGHSCFQKDNQWQVLPDGVYEMVEPYTLRKAMTVEQIESWRRTLCIMLGPYALIMPEYEIVSFRNRLQESLAKETEEVFMNGTAEPNAYD